MGERAETQRVAHRVLLDLDAMLEEDNEPDFQHRPTHHAYGFARSILTSAYAQLLGSAPIPTIAPDGQGGVVTEWNDGAGIVRLVSSSVPDKRSYIYFKGAESAEVDYAVSGESLARRIQLIFSR